MKADLAKLRAIVAFLLGEGELDGLWFGEKKDVLRGTTNYPTQYWWRSQLRKEIDELLAIAEAVERAPVVEIGRHAHMGPMALIDDESLVGKRVRLLAIGEDG